MNRRLLAILMGIVAISVGVLINYFGDRLINYVAPPPGIRLELFWGVSTFSPYWVLALFVPPLIAGFVVSMIYGLGGKLICYFVPIIVRGFSYYQMMGQDDLPDGVTLLPFGYWVLVLIVAIEAAAIGGVFGEILMKKTYGRRPRHLLYKNAADNNSPNPES